MTLTFRQIYVRTLKYGLFWKYAPGTSAKPVSGNLELAPWQLQPEGNSGRGWRFATRHRQINATPLEV